MRLTTIRPDEDAIIAALTRVLESETFSRSDRARTLLDYLVRSELAGQADRLKGFAIAMDVFGKDADFDPATDAVVRVQAGRLRDLLEQYYTREGAGETLRITVARGTYVPSYAAEPAMPEPAAPGEGVELDSTRISAAIAARFSDADGEGLPIGSGGRTPEAARVTSSIARNVRLFGLGLAFAIAMLTFVTWRLATDGPHPAAGPELAAASTAKPRSGIANVEFLPVVTLVVVSPEDAGVAPIAAQLRAAVPAFDAVNFVAGDPKDAGTAGDSFVIHVEPGAVPGQTLVRIRHAASGRDIAGATFNPQQSAEDMDLDFARLVNSSFPVSGAIYAHIEETRATNPLTECLVLENRFFLNLRAEDHAAAHDCFDELARKGAKSPLVWAELADLEVAAVTGNLGHPADASLEKAVRYARKAVELGPNSAAAFRAEGYVLDRTGDRQAGLEWMRKAAEINPYDMSLLASVGNSLVLGGDYEKGFDLLSRAVRVAPVHPYWWDYAEFLGALMTDKQDAAWRAADALVDSDRRHYLAARLVAATGRGRTAEAGEIAATLASHDREFVADPMAAFLKARYAPELAERFAKAIKAAMQATGAG